MTHPSRTSDPYFNHPHQRAQEQAKMAYFTHGWIAGIAPECDYSPHLGLLPGQQWEIFYGPHGPSFPGGSPSGCGQDNWDFSSNTDEAGHVRNRKVWPWRGQYLTKATDPRCGAAGPDGHAPRHRPAELRRYRSIRRRWRRAARAWLARSLTTPRLDCSIPEYRGKWRK